MFVMAGLRPGHPRSCYMILSYGRNEALVSFAADEGRGCPGQARARRLVRRSDTITERLEEASWRGHDALSAHVPTWRPEGGLVSLCGRRGRGCAGRPREPKLRRLPRARRLVRRSDTITGISKKHLARWEQHAIDTAVIPREGGVSSTRRLCRSDRDAGDYWIVRLRGR